mgnify:CR=1 FL=1|jgi:hypothetical protein
MTYCHNKGGLFAGSPYRVVALTKNLHILSVDTLPQLS